jgi:hypothetical protein
LPTSNIEKVNDVADVRKEEEEKEFDLATDELEGDNDESIARFTMFNDKLKSLMSAAGLDDSDMLLVSHHEEEKCNSCSKNTFMFAIQIEDDTAIADAILYDKVG